MAISLKRIALGAAGKVGEQIIKNAEYIREEEKNKKDYLFTKALEGQAKVKQAQQKLMNEYSTLRDMGVDERRLKRYMKNNPKAVSYLAGIVAQNPGKLDGADLNTFFKINEENPDITDSIEDLVDQAFVQYSDVELPKSPQEKEKTFLQRLFSGVDTDEINRNVAMAEILPGVTGGEVIAGMDRFGQLRSGSGVTRPDYSVLGEEKYDNRMLLTQRTDMIEEYNDYLETQLNSLQGDTANSKTYSKLLEIKKLGTTNRLNALIRLNPSIAQRYFNEPYGSELFDPERGIFSSSTSALLSPREEGEGREEESVGVPPIGAGNDTGSTTLKTAPGVSIPKSLETEITLNNDGVPVFDSMEEAQAANEKGLLGPAFIKGEGTANLTADITDTSSLAGISAASGGFSTDPTLSVEDRVKAKREATSNVVEGVSSTIAGIDNALDTIAGNTVLEIREKANTALGAIAQVTGNDRLADHFYRVSIEAEDGTRKGVQFDKGLVDGINKILDDMGVADYSKVRDEPDAVNQYVDDPNTEGRNLDADLGVGFEPATTRLFSTMDRLKKLRLAVNEDPENVTPEAVAEAVLEPSSGTQEYDAALQRAPEHIEKLGSQAMSAWRKLTAKVKEYQGVAQDARGTVGASPVAESYTQEEILAWYENHKKTKENAEMEERIRDDARQFLQDRRSFPQPLPTIVIDRLADDVVEEAKVDKEVTRVVQQLNQKGDVPSRKEVEALKKTLELNQEIDTSTQELYRGPISGKTLVEKLDDIYNFYTQEESEYDPRTIGTVGFQDLGLRSTADDVRYPRSESPDAQTRTRAPLGDTRTDPDPTLPASMVVEQTTTRGKKATPSGLMSPPDRGSEPKVGESVLLGTIKRLHGSGSKVSKDFAKKVSSGTIKAADVTRLINSTKKLPKSGSRQTLLESLYELRDTLNKR